VSGADRKSGKDRMRSTRSNGMSGMVDAVRGEGLTGRAGLVSMLKDLRRVTESGIGVPLLRNGEAPLLRLILWKSCAENV
jgi:hypothetical protein